MIPIIIVGVLIAYFTYPGGTALFGLCAMAAFIYAAVQNSKSTNAKDEVAQKRGAEAEAIKASDIALAQGTAQLDAQLDALRRNQTFCEEKLKTLSEPPRGTWP